MDKGKELPEGYIKGGKGGMIKPPQPGEVRNPKGGKKGPSFKKIMRKMLAHTTDMEGVKMTKKEKSVLLLIGDAIDEDLDPIVRMKALTTIMDRVEGQSKTKSEVKHKGIPKGNPIFTINFEDRAEEAADPLQTPPMQDSQE
jgi:hypothetical protein